MNFDQAITLDLIGPNLLKPGVTYHLKYEDDLDLNSFTIVGRPNRPNCNKGDITLDGVPDDRHEAYFNLDAEQGFKILVANDSWNRALYIESSGGVKTTLQKQAGADTRTTFTIPYLPFVIAWDTMLDLPDVEDVRVWIEITPLVDKKSFIMKYTVKTLKQVYREDYARRRENCPWWWRWFFDTYEAKPD